MINFISVNSLKPKVMLKKHILTSLALALLFFSCSDNKSSSTSSQSNSADSSQPTEKNNVAATNYNTSDSSHIATSLSSKARPYRFYWIAVEGTMEDIVSFYGSDYDDNRGGTMIARDAIRDGNHLNHEGDYAKRTYWNGVEWHTMIEGERHYEFDIWPYGFGKSQASNSGNYFIVRHGRVRDRVYLYAIVDGVVYRSKEWSDAGDGETYYGVAITRGDKSVSIKGYPFSEKEKGNPTSSSSFGTIAFDPSTKKFSYSAGNGAAFSTEPSKQERMVPIDK